MSSATPSLDAELARVLAELRRQLPLIVSPRAPAAKIPLLRDLGRFVTDPAEHDDAAP